MQPFSMDHGSNQQQKKPIHNNLGYRFRVGLLVAAAEKRNRKAREGGTGCGFRV